MSAETTPAVERAAEALKAATGVTYPWALDVTPRMLAAALDVEEMACAMWVLDHPYYTSESWRTEPSEVSREIYRALARAARTAILGGAS